MPGFVNTLKGRGHAAPQGVGPGRRRGPEQLTPVIENELHVEPIVSEPLRVASGARHVLATHNGFQQRVLRLNEKMRHRS
jgi:hypothetical protein